MGGTASANRDRDTSKSKKADASPVNSRVFDGGATNASLSTASKDLRNVKPKTRDDIAGAAEFNELGALGKITNDLAMGFGMKPRDDSYDARTAATRAREAGPKSSDIGYESRTDQRANSKSIIAKPAPAPVTAAETETETVDVKTAPPDPDTLPVGEAEAEVVKTVPKLGKKSTIATSNQGLETNSGQGLLRKKRSLMGMIK